MLLLSQTLRRQSNNKTRNVGFSTSVPRAQNLECFRHAEEQKRTHVRMRRGMLAGSTQGDTRDNIFGSSASLSKDFRERGEKNFDLETRFIPPLTIQAAEVPHVHNIRERQSSPGPFGISKLNRTVVLVVPVFHPQIQQRGPHNENLRYSADYLCFSRRRPSK